MTDGQGHDASRPDDRRGPPLLEVRDLHVSYRVNEGLFRHRPLRAVDGVGFRIDRSETLGLVGESGSGKSTVGRAIVQVQPVARGEILLDGLSLTRTSRRDSRSARRRIQMIFQDPYSSLNPRHRIADIVIEPLVIRGARASSARPLAAGLLERVGLDGRLGSRYPHTLSGGQRQRVAIARAMASRPDLIVCDEPVSALDVSNQAQIVNLLADLRREYGISLLFIAHDLAVVRHISDRVAVMYLGRLMEWGDTSVVYGRPLHPYTMALLSAVPVPDARPSHARRRIILKGDIPSPMDPPSGCRFRTRCPWARQVCADVEPEARVVEGRTVACHFAGTLRLEDLGADDATTHPSGRQPPSKGDAQ